MRECPLRIGHAGADDQVAGGAVREAQRTAGVGGNQSADGGGFLGGRIQGEKLALFAEYALQLGQTHAGFDGHRQIGRLVLHDPVQTGGLDDQVETRRRHAEVQLGAATDRGNGAAGLIRAFERRR